MQRLLLRRAVVEDRRADPVGSVVLPTARLEVRPHLLADGDRRREVEVLASVLGGPVGHQQALARQHLAEPVAQLEVDRVVRERTEPALGELFGDQRAKPRPQRARTWSGSSWTKASEESSAVILALRSTVGARRATLPVPPRVSRSSVASSSASCVGSRGVEPEDEPLSRELLEWIARTVGGRGRPDPAPGSLASQLLRRRRCSRARDRRPQGDRGAPSRDRTLGAALDVQQPPGGGHAGAAPGPRREGAALPRVPRRQQVVAHGEGRGFGAGARTQ